MSQLHFIQFANLALHLSGRAKSLNNANVFDKVFKFFFLLCFTFPYSLLWSLLSFLEDGVFTFSLMAYMDDAHKIPLYGSVDLDVEIFFKAEVETQSNAPNLDLYPVRCYSSQSDNPDDTGANFTLISNG